MCNKVKKRTVYEVEGLPDETFDDEADAAVAAILVMMNADGNNWDILEEGLRANAENIRKQLNIVLEPRNRRL